MASVCRSLQCLISALAQTGGGDLSFRFASSVQSCCGEGGALKTDLAVCGSTRRVPATLGLPRTGVSVLSPSTLLRLPAALYGAGPASSAVPVFGSSTKARIRLRLPDLSGSGSQRLGRPLPGNGAPFPSVAAARAARGLCDLSTGAARLFPPRPQRPPLVGSQGL